MKTKRVPNAFLTKNIYNRALTKKGGSRWEATFADAIVDRTLRFFSQLLYTPSQVVTPREDAIDLTLKTMSRKHRGTFLICRTPSQKIIVFVEFLDVLFFEFHKLLSQRLNFSLGYHGATPEIDVDVPVMC